MIDLFLLHQRLLGLSQQQKSPVENLKGEQLCGAVLCVLSWKWTRTYSQVSAHDTEAVSLCPFYIRRGFAFVAVSLEPYEWWFRSARAFSEIRGNGSAHAQLVFAGEPFPSAVAPPLFTRRRCCRFCCCCEAWPRLLPRRRCSPSLTSSLTWTAPSWTRSAFSAACTKNFVAVMERPSAGKWNP